MQNRFSESDAQMAQSKMNLADAERYMHAEGFDCYHGSDTGVVSCRRNKSCMTLFGMFFQGTCAENVDLILTTDRRAIDRVETQPKQCFGL